MKKLRMITNKKNVSGDVAFLTHQKKFFEPHNVRFSSHFENRIFRALKYTENRDSDGLKCNKICRLTES